jgi:hypothetical protein
MIKYSKLENDFSPDRTFFFELVEERNSEK